MATYVSMVNSVLTRLREDTVTSVSDTSYSALIGQLLNDAKREVEDSWQWSSLLDYVDIPVTAGVSTYSLNSLNGGLTGAPLKDRARVRVDLRKGYAQAYLMTKGYESSLSHYQFDANSINLAVYTNNSQTGTPTGFSLTPLAPASWVDGQINKNIQIFPIPDTSYTIRVFFSNPQVPLSNDTDVIYVPYDPVVQRAYMFALYERGEELGENLTLTSNKTNAALQDAIAHDQNNQAHESGFFVDQYNPAPAFFSLG